MFDDQPMPDSWILDRYELDLTIDEEKNNMIFCVKFSGAMAVLGAGSLELASNVGSVDNMPASTSEAYLDYSGVIFLGAGALALVSGYQYLRRYTSARQKAIERDY